MYITNGWIKGLILIKVALVVNDCFLVYADTLAELSPGRTSKTTHFPFPLGVSRYYNPLNAANNVPLTDMKDWVILRPEFVSLARRRLNSVSTE